MATCPFARSANSNGNTSKADDTGVRYMDQLSVNVLRNLQNMLSDVHDEHFFYVVHQTMELWFHQIIVEIDSVRKLFMKQKLIDSNLLVVVARLNRIVKIMQILIEQATIMETMTPLEFVDFRDLLTPASGFESLQFRLIENKLGVRKEIRVKRSNQEYSADFSKEEKDECDVSESEPSLFAVIQDWLEMVQDGGDVNFWKKFTLAVDSHITDHCAELEMTSNETVQEMHRQRLDKMKALFANVLEEENYTTSLMKGDRRFSHKAVKGALQIFYYRHEVVYNLPFQLLTACMDIDEQLAKWKYSHMMLAQRQIGSRLGTSASAGYYYLKATTSDRYRVFDDLVNLSSYLVPSSYVTPLSEEERKRLTMFFVSGEAIPSEITTSNEKD